MMRWIIVGSIALITGSIVGSFLIIADRTIDRIHVRCASADGVWLSRESVCIRKDAIIDVSTMQSTDGR